MNDPSFIFSLLEVSIDSFLRRGYNTRRTLKQPGDEL